MKLFKKSLISLQNKQISPLWQTELLIFTIACMMYYTKQPNHKVTVNLWLDYLKTT